MKIKGVNICKLLSTVIGPLGTIFYVLAIPVNLVVLKKIITPKPSGIHY